ncbi:hypothetical protein ACO0QE_001004 [Hanseniaspora vineae]
MQMLPEGQKNTVQVTYEDQLKINEFSKLILQKDDVDKSLTQEKTEKEYLDDILLEIELLDEDEYMNYKIGESFLLMKQKKIVRQLNKDLSKIESKIESLESKNSDIMEKLQNLKTALYVKFGNNINLER